MLIAGALVGANVPRMVLHLAHLPSECTTSEPISAANDRFPSERSCAGRRKTTQNVRRNARRLPYSEFCRGNSASRQASIRSLNAGSELRAGYKSSSCWRHMVNARISLLTTKYAFCGCVIVKYRKATRLFMGLCRQFNSPMRESRRRIAGTYIALPCRWQHQPETHWAGAEFLVRATL